MSGWVEVMVGGNCRAFVRAGNVAGVLTPAGLSATQMATPDAPISLLMTSGPTLEGVYGVSAQRLLFHLEGATILARGKGIAVAYLDSIAEFESKIAEALGAHG